MMLNMEQFLVLLDHFTAGSSNFYDIYKFLELLGCLISNLSLICVKYEQIMMK